MQTNHLTQPSLFCLSLSLLTIQIPLSSMSSPLPSIAPLETVPVDTKKRKLDSDTPRDKTRLIALMLDCMVSDGSILRMRKIFFLNEAKLDMKAFNARIKSGKRGYFFDLMWGFEHRTLTDAIHSWKDITQERNEQPLMWCENDSETIVQVYCMIDD
jgi:hypothetical protein